MAVSPSCLPANHYIPAFSTRVVSGFLIENSRTAPKVLDFWRGSAIICKQEGPDLLSGRPVRFVSSYYRKQPSLGRVAVALLHVDHNRERIVPLVERDGNTHQPHLPIPEYGRFRWPPAPLAIFQFTIFRQALQAFSEILSKQAQGRAEST